MSKYQPLSERLSGHPAGEWRASFAEIEEVLGFPLPKAARSGSAWWNAEAEKPHARAWRGPGWSVGEVDHAGGVVTFRRLVSEPAMQGAPAPVVSPQPESSAQHPTDKKIGSEIASVISRTPRWGVAALVAGAAAVLGVVGGLVIRSHRRRLPQPDA